MLKLGFSDTWVRWIMACVSSVRYSIRFNGVLSEPFQPTRGLRQGDPLSPYLFLFVADALSVVLQKEIGLGRVEELKVSRNAPGISHLLFADDALLFFRANAEQAGRTKQVLQLFQSGTGQLLSPAKCSILARETLQEEVQEQIRHILGVVRVDFDAKYLGLPTPDGRQKAERFQPIKDRLAKRISSWSEKFLSSGAKEILIKSVAQTIPHIYHECFSAFKYTLRGSRSYCQEILVGGGRWPKKDALDCLGEVYQMQRAWMTGVP